MSLSDRVLEWFAEHVLGWFVVASFIFFAAFFAWFGYSIFSHSQ